MQRLIIERSLVIGQVVEFTREQRHYLVDVLRLKAGDAFIGLDPTGGGFTVQIEPGGSGGLVMGPATEPDREAGISLRLFLPLLKGNKLDLVVQKSVELGVAAIDFYLARRAVVTPDNFSKRRRRLEKIAAEAARQCRRQIVPPLGGPYTLAAVAATNPGLFAWEEEKCCSLKQCMDTAPPKRLSLLTGPEGGLEPSEAQMLTEAGWQAVTLGQRILRAETAAIVLVACALFAVGEMG